MFTTKFRKLYEADGGAGAGTGGAAAGGQQNSGAGTGGAGTGGSQSGGATPPPAADWTANLSPEMKGFVQNKGYKGPEDAILSYQNLEKLMGGSPDRLIKLTENWDKDAAIQGEIFTKLGKPGKADEYTLQTPEGGGSKEMMDWAKNAFHDANLTKGQAEKLSGKWNEYIQNQQKIAADANKAKVEQEIEGLKKEWGATYEANLKKGQAAANEFGVKAELIDKLQESMGYAEVMKFFAKIGEKVGEHGFVSGASGSSGGMTPEAAQAQIKSYMADKNFATKYINGDKDAKDIMNKLHQYAAAGKDVAL